MAEKETLVDLLDEDKPVANQKFVCVSFVSPEKILKQKQDFLFEEFTKEWDTKERLQKFTEFMNFLAYKYNIKFDDMMSDLNDYVKEEGNKLRDFSITDHYKTFLDNMKNDLLMNLKRSLHFKLVLAV